jgi:CheY-like chemotaxis protein
MSDEIFSLRVLVVLGSPAECDLFRQAASQARVPVEIVAADGAAAAGRALSDGIDLVFIDMALGGDLITQVTAAAHAAAKPPFTVLLCAPGSAAPFQTDALASKPEGIDETKRLMHASIRVRMPSRVLIVDDSATMRSIVRKVLTATGFPFDISEVRQGMEAVELAREQEFDIVFLDYNLPGLSGLETIAEFRRAQRRPTFVLMTSTADEAIVARARAQGAAFLKKPFFPADIEAVLCEFYGLRALNPTRVSGW